MSDGERVMPFRLFACFAAEREVEHTDVVIVGAGVGGLALSRALARRDVPHVVLERDAEPGGMIRTVRVHGHVLEAGPQRLRLTPRLRELVRALRIEDQLLLAPRGLPIFIYRRGALRLAPLSLAELRRTDLFSWAGRLRILAEPLTRPAREGETVAEYFSRRFGGSAYNDLLGPLFGGLYASDPADMLVRHALLPTLRELGGTRSTVLGLIRRAVNGRRGPADAAIACSFRSGLRTLTDAMHESVRKQVRMSTPAVAIEKNTDGYRVITHDDRHAVRHVVLTCPAPDAAALLRRLAPHASAALETLHYNEVVIVYLLAELVRRGMGYQVSFAEPLHTRGVTFNHSLFGRVGVYTAFLGGAREPDLAARNDATIAALAAREFEQVTGCPAEPIRVARARIPAWDRSWIGLDDLKLPPGIHLCTNYESRIGVLGRIARAEQLAEQMTGHVATTR